MPNDDKVYLFEKMPISKAIIKLAIPTVLSSLVMVIYNLADTYFVGMLNDAIQNAAVTLAAPILLSLTAVTNLFGVGSSSLMSRSLGSKDYKRVSQSSAIGFYCALFLGITISVLCFTFNRPLLQILGVTAETSSATYNYLKWTIMCGAAPAILNVVLAFLVRAEGASLHASIGTMSGCILNIILDPIFILPWGLDMGASGAGLATFLSNCVACLYFIVLINKKKENTYISIKFSQFSLDKAVLFSIFAVGIPAAIQNLLNVTGMTILNNLTASYGTDAVAAMGIAQKINMVPVQIALGMSQGIMPLISYNYSARNIERMKNTLTTTLKIALAFIVVVVAGYYFQSRFFISMFMSNQTIVDYGSAFLRNFCLGLPFLCIDFVAVGVFQAVGMGKESLFFAIMRKIILEIPALIILNQLIPLYGLSLAQFTSEIILASLAFVVLSKLFKKLSNEKTVATA
jgi:putative efflux protein, MATE family